VKKKKREAFLLDMVGRLQAAERTIEDIVDDLRAKAEPTSLMGYVDLSVAMVALSHSLERYQREVSLATMAEIRRADNEGNR
jgi:hypothetical protein